MRAPEQAIKRIRALAADRNFSVAFRDLSELSDKYPDDPWVDSLAGFVHARARDLEQAIASILEAIRKDDQQPHFHYKHGIYLFRIGRYAEAIESLTRVIEISNANDFDYYLSSAYFLRAETFLKLGNREHALADCAAVPDGMKTWTDRIRTKEDLVADSIS